MKFNGIKRKNWYIVSLSLPILVPLTFVIEGSRGYFWFVLKFSAVPYLLFSFAVLWWGRNKNTEDMYRISWILPAIFALFALVSSGGFFMVETLIDGKAVSVLEEIQGFIGRFGVMATIGRFGVMAAVCIYVVVIGYIFVLINGYIYVILTHSITCCLTWAGILKE